ncbi:hypothetical protein [Oleidesulfovibrio sp.]|uniref:hypothetical protein n=1 Tax=Oleidesulfovibrio sp. TaxID=2909707 RepID=UPI003A8AABED
MCVVEGALGAALVGSTLFSGKGADGSYYKHQQGVLEERARNEEEQAVRQADQIRRKGQVHQGGTRALLAAQGVRVDQGSALDLLLNDEALFEDQAQEALYQGKERAWNYRTQAYGQSLRYQPQEFDYLGTVKKVGSLLGKVGAYAGS